MVLKFKDRSSPKNKIRIHVCGLTGHGKSTFAEEYCKQAGLKPIVIDIDDTNYTSVLNPDVQFTGNSKQIFDKIEKTLKDVVELGNSDCDTIIFDGVDSAAEKITPLPKAGNPYWHFGMRKQRWDSLMSLLLNSGKHIIFIGQLDSKITDDPERKPSAPVKAMNNCVNVSYFCYVTKEGEFRYDIMKNRFGDFLKGLDVYDNIPYIVKQETKDIEEPPQLILDCITALKSRGRTPTVDTIKVCIVDKCKDQDEQDDCINWLEENDLGDII